MSAQRKYPDELRERAIRIVVGAFIPGKHGMFDLVIVGLLTANLVLAAVLIQPGGLTLLHSHVLLAVDLAVAAALFLWTTTLVKAGTIVEPNPDNAWTYIMATVTFWFAARGKNRRKLSTGRRPSGRGCRNDDQWGRRRP